jgi:hypothetical protein
MASNTSVLCELHWDFALRPRDEGNWGPYGQLHHGLRVDQVSYPYTFALEILRVPASLLSKVEAGHRLRTHQNLHGKIDL